MLGTDPNRLDDHGNYGYEGEFHRRGEKFDDLIPRIVAHLGRTFPEHRFSPDRQHYAGGRSVTMRVISGPEGLADRDAGEDFKRRVMDEMKRFNSESGNVLSDHHSGSFHGRCEIDARYHQQHAKVDAGTAVDRTMTLASFRKAVKAGDRITLIATNNAYSQKLLDQERVISEVRSGDFIVGEGKGRSYFTYPKAAGFACDGERIRISDASAHQPDAYRLYRWHRT